MRRSSIAVLLFAIALLASVPLEGQKHPNIELGFSADRLYQFNNLDSVNLYNGNLIVTIPIGDAYATDASFQYGLTLVYNGKIWDYYRQSHSDVEYTISEPNWRSNAGVGWRLSMGRLLGPTTGSSYYPSNDTNRWIYEGPSGDEHPFPYDEDDDEEVKISMDQDHLRMVRVSSTERLIEFPNGDRHKFLYERGRWRLRSLYDRFDNTLEVSSVWENVADTSNGVETAWLLIDSAERSHTVHFAKFAGNSQTVDRGQHVSSIVLASIGGSATYEFTVQEETVEWGCGHYVYSGWNIPAEATVPLLKKLKLPDGTSYNFTYYNTEADGGHCSQGALATMAVPTGGETSYEYQHVWLPESFCYASTFGERNPGVKSRTTPDGRWDYVLALAPEQEVDFPQAQHDCGVTTEFPTVPSPVVQPLYRWSRMSVLSPSVTGHDGSTLVSRRVRTDNYFYTWVKNPAPPDPWNPTISNSTERLVLFGQPLTSGAPPVGALGPLTTAVADVPAVDGIGADLRHLSTRVYECPAVLLNGDCTGGRLLRSASMRMARPAWGGENDGDWRYAYPTESTRTTFHDDTGCGTLTAPETCWVQTTNSDPDGVGKYRRAETTTNFPAKKGELSVFTNYAGWTTAQTKDDTRPWILQLYDRVERTDTSGSAYSAACFDPATGVVLGSRVMSGSSYGAKDLLAVYSYDARGNLKEERNYGGDLQSVPTSGACVAPSSAAQYLIRNTYNETGSGDARKLSVKSEYCDPASSTAEQCTSVLTRLDVDLHRNSGRPVASRDVSGIVTTYSYQANTGLLTSVAPSGVAPTSYSYQRTAFPHSVTISTDATAGATQSVIEFDSVGRVAKTITLMPEEEGQQSSSVVSTTYDALGRRSAVSEPYVAGSTSPLALTTFEYDPFGRTSRVQAPDGSVATWAHTGTRETTRGSSVRLTSGLATVNVKEVYDGLGRLIEVQENSGPGGALVSTKYGYDVGSRLTKVEMYGAESGTPIQSRAFEYDKLGLLREEKHPESDRVFYTGYDARGHARLKLFENPALTSRPVTPHDLRFSFDKAERPTLVEMQHPTQTAESFLSLKQFIYEVDQSVFDNKTSYTKGKLFSATRWNYEPNPSPDPLDPLSNIFKVTETYAYADDAGRMTDRTTRIEHLDSGDYDLVREIRQHVEHNDLGLPQRVDYPSCTECTYPATKALTSTYSAGKLQRLDRTDDGNTSRRVAEVAYWPNGMTKTIVHGNDMSDEVQLGTDLMPRPKRIKFLPWEECVGPAWISIAVTPGSTISVGQSATLTASVGPSLTTTPITYQWWILDENGLWNEFGSPSQSPWIEIIGLAQTTTYKVHASNACHLSESGTVTTTDAIVAEAMATVTVSSCEPPELATQPISRTVQPGTSVTLSVSAVGTAPLSYAWYVVGSPNTVIESSRVLTIASITQTTRYACRITNGCGEITSEESTITVPLPGPTALTATRSAAQTITLNWTAAAGAHHYVIQRRSAGGGFVSVGTSATTTYPDQGLPSGVTYVYRVFAVSSTGGSASTASNADLATTMTFTSVVPGSALDDAPYHELLTALNALRAADAAAPLTWTTILPAGVSPPGPGVSASATHVAALRDRMNTALQALGVAAGSYADDPVRQSETLIRAAHVTALQQRAQ